MAIKDALLTGAGRVLRGTFPPSGLGRFCDRFSGAGAFTRLRPSRIPKFQILVYHRVLPEPDPFSIGVVPAPVFRGQMSVLRRCFRVIPLKQLIKELSQGGPGPGTVCVTFDDGYHDNFRFALPLLEEFGIPATVFLATDFIGSGRVLWYDRVLNACKHTRAARLVLEEAFPEPLKLEGGTSAADLARAARAHDLTRWLKRFPPAERDGYIARILSQLGESPAGERDGMLSWDTVREMTMRRVDIGAHSMSHPILTRLAPEDSEAEIAGSKRAIEAEIDAEVTLFAYPNGQRGDFDETLKGHLRKHGFTCAVTTVEGVNTPARDRLELYRRQPWESDADGFLFRMCAERLVA